jgi:hypothetical protein
VKRLRRAAVIAFVTHLVAGLCMLIVLGPGLDTNPDIGARLQYIASHRAAWTGAWLTWHLAAFSILYFYAAFTTVHGLKRYAVYLTILAMAADFTGETIEWAFIPSVAATAYAPLHRSAVLLSGFVGNTLYSLSALFLARSAREAYPRYTTIAGYAVGAVGMALSVSVVIDSATGMLWTNALLLPILLLWLTLTPNTRTILGSPRESGGTGRRARLRI